MSPIRFIILMVLILESDSEILNVKTFKSENPYVTREYPLNLRNGYKSKCSSNKDMIVLCNGHSEDIKSHKVKESWKKGNEEDLNVRITRGKIVNNKTSNINNKNKLIKIKRKKVIKRNNESVGSSEDKTTTKRVPKPKLQNINTTSTNYKNTDRLLVSQRENKYNECAGIIDGSILINDLLDGTHIILDEYLKPEYTKTNHTVMAKPFTSPFEPKHANDIKSGKEEQSLQVKRKSMTYVQKSTNFCQPAFTSNLSKTCITSAVTSEAGKRISPNRIFEAIQNATQFKSITTQGPIKQISILDSPKIGLQRTNVSETLHGTFTQSALAFSKSTPEIFSDDCHQRLTKPRYTFFPVRETFKKKNPDSIYYAFHEFNTNNKSHTRQLNFVSPKETNPTASYKKLGIMIGRISKSFNVTKVISTKSPLLHLHQYKTPRVCTTSKSPILKQIMDKALMQ